MIGLRYIILAILVSFFVIGIGYGATPSQTIVGSDTATMNGPAGVGISLGFEYVPGMSLAQAVWFYNIIAMMGLIAIATMASYADVESTSILLVGFTGFFMFIGWLQAPNPALEYSIIIGMGLLAAALYMKSRMREIWGLGGPGTTLLNVVIFIIILESTVALVNNSGVFSQNYGTGGNDFSGISASAQSTVVGQASGGGALTSLISTGSLVGTLLVAAIVGFLSIIEGVFLFYFVVTAAFPILTGSSIALAIAGLMNIGWDILLIKLLYDIFYTKSVFIDV
jgi:hypothetical protein